MSKRTKAVNSLDKTTNNVKIENKGNLILFS